MRHVTTSLQYHHGLNLKVVNGNTHAGIKWVDGNELSDLDFADDVVLLYDSWAGMQAMTLSLEDKAKKVGLIMNYY